MPYLEEYQSLSSFQFANPQFPSIIWALRVYPNTKAKHADSQYETSGGFVSLIRKEPVNNTIKAKYIIYATDVKQMLRIDIATLLVK
ncbi:BTB domain-containing protein [Meloidogyne graminicola]|uniref:BTB domain-containing protein n=1 Tax=Meloidogyne graminicola TaxID=189291 RepID=A0A8S9ZSZ3_9BILA|nr:BTB domain-containing protein [Meloidogyne graminicola]